MTGHISLITTKHKIVVCTRTSSHKECFVLDAEVTIRNVNM